MNAESFLALYDRITDAPGAIPRLRRSIFDLAIRGKLVEQDPNDEPVSETLIRINEQKSQLDHASKVGDQRKSDANYDSSIAIPSSWMMVSLSDVVLNHFGGGTPSKRNSAYWNGSIPWASVKDVGSSKYLDQTIDTITKAGLENSSSNFVQPGNLIVVTRMSLGKVSINRIPVAINQDLRALQFAESVNIEYAYIFFLTFRLKGSGLTVKGVRLADLMNIPFPLPTSAEQTRIVDKVDELIALCDKLEYAHAERENKRDRLTKASYSHLNTPSTRNDTFQTNAKFTINRLSKLTSKPEQVEQLRQTVLNLAVRGKLVKQNPTDEPASEILRKILLEKFKNNRMGRQIGRNVSESDELNLFGPPVPSGWSITTLDSILIELKTGPFGSSLHKHDYRIGGVPVINPASIQGGKIIPIKNMAVGKDTLERLSSFKFQSGDIVMGRRGEMGRCAVVTDEEQGWLCGTGSLILRMPVGLGVSSSYLAMVIGSPQVKEYLSYSSVGATMRNLNQQILLGMIIAVPPYNEQLRILSKVDTLMILCDQLEARLRATNRVRNSLLESLISFS